MMMIMIMIMMMIIIIIIKCRVLHELLGRLYSCVFVIAAGGCIYI